MSFTTAELINDSLEDTVLNITRNQTCLRSVRTILIQIVGNQTFTKNKRQKYFPRGKPFIYINIK